MTLFAKANINYWFPCSFYYKPPKHWSVLFPVFDETTISLFSENHEMCSHRYFIKVLRTRYLIQFRREFKAKPK